MAASRKEIKTGVVHLAHPSCVKECPRLWRGGGGETVVDQEELPSDSMVGLKEHRGIKHTHTTAGLDKAWIGGGFIFVLLVGVYKQVAQCAPMGFTPIGSNPGHRTVHRHLDKTS